MYAGPRVVGAARLVRLIPMRRPLRDSLFVMVGLLVLASFGALVLWGGDDVAPPASAGSALDVDPIGAASPVEAGADVDSRARAVDAEAPAEVRRSAVSEPGAAAATITLQVWDGEVGKPAVAAEVFVVESRRSTSRWGTPSRDPFALHPLEQVESDGRRYVTRRDGTVMLPALTAWSATAVARLPGRFGSVTLRRGSAEAVLVLGADEAVIVTVVDGSGEPVAGAPVAIQQRIPTRVDVARLQRELASYRSRLAAERKLSQASDQPQDARRDFRIRWLQRRVDDLAVQNERMSGLLEKSQRRQAQVARAAGRPAPRPATTVIETRWDVRARRRTDESGRAVFSHFQLLQTAAEEWWPKALRGRFEAVLVIPLADSPRVEFVAGGVEAEVEVELRMPPTGSVALRTVDRDGRPFTHPVHGELRLHDGANPAWTRNSLRKEQNEDAIVFPFVGLGLQLQARCRLDDDDFRWTSPVFAGPQRAGEHVTYDLVVAPDAGMLRGRVLDGVGVPLADADVTFLINSVIGRLEGEQVQLDRDGRFHLPYLMPRGHRAPFRLQVRYEEREPVPGLARTLPGLPMAQVVDLGDMQLDAFQCIAFGQVVDDRGEPVAGARVQLQRQRARGRSGDELVFLDEAFTDTAADDEGRFMLFGDVEPGRYRLQVRANRHFPFESDGLPGRDGILVRLEREARFEGVVRLPAWIESRDVELRFEARVDPRHSGDARLSAIRRDGDVSVHRFRSGDLHADVYDLAIRLRNQPDPFVRIAGLRLEAGARGVHPQLAAIDATGILHRFEVRAADLLGKPVSPRVPLLVRVTRPDGSTGLIGFPWRGSTVTIVHASPTLEVVPRAHGMRAEPAWLVPGENELRFRVATPVRLRLRGLYAQLAGLPAYVMAEPVGGIGLLAWDAGSERQREQHARIERGWGRLSKHDIASLALPADGRYRVRVFVGERGKQGVFDVGELDVRDVGGAPRVQELAFDAQQAQAAIDRARAAGR